jgi:hypothetical protein
MAEVKRRRGLSTATKGVQAPSFNPTMDKYNGLNLATVVVTVEEKEAKEDTKQLAFVGLTVPSLVFRFIQADADGVQPAEYVHSFRPMDYSDDTLTEEKKMEIEENNMEMINHFLLVMSGKTFDEAGYEKEGLFLDLEDGEVNGEKVLKAYKDFFTNVAKVINENPRIAKQKFWLKLIRYAKTHVLRGGAAAIGNFLQKGWVEVAKSGVESNLSIAIEKGESIKIRETVVTTNPAAAPAGAPAGQQAGSAPAGAPAVPQWADDDEE